MQSCKSHWVCVWNARWTCVFVFCWKMVGHVHCSRDLQIRNSVKKSLKLGSTRYYSYLKIILLQYFQFSVINGILTNPKSILFSLLTLTATHSTKSFILFCFFVLKFGCWPQWRYDQALDAWYFLSRDLATNINLSCKVSFHVQI